MTRDELLSKIDSFTCCSGAHELALRAVVEIADQIKTDFPVDHPFVTGWNEAMYKVLYTIGKELS